MKKRSFLGIFGILLSTALLVFSCEKDDICVEGTLTTPLLVIEFFDAQIAIDTGEDVAKNTSDLWVEAVEPNTEEINGVTFIVDPIQSSPQAVSTISIPLRVTEDATEYRFIKDYALDDDGNQLGNEDILTFNYARQEIFLSRACGYYTNYTLNETDGAVVTADTENWISVTDGIEISQNIVQNETVTHVKIYH
jgi:ABC-type antimicrobial peptide transport system permease subunit